VASAPRSVESGGIGWISVGIRRLSSS
jgi:hypothetical protein